jgi:S1-C subfamily serine protease
MKKVLLALAFGLVGTSSNAWDVKDMNQHIDQTNFIVNGMCSGTLIDLEDRLVLTNHHCVTRNISTKMEQSVSPDGTIRQRRVTDTSIVTLAQRAYDGHEITSQFTYVGNLVAWDETIDLALVQLRSDSIPMSREAEIFTGKIYRGEVAWVVGNPLGMDNTVMKGVISSTNRNIKIGRSFIPYLQVDAGITGGNSGGSLYNDNGQLIGVPGAAARGTVVGLAIPSEFIIKFLDKFCRGYVYNPTAPSYEECINPTEEAPE